MGLAITTVGACRKILDMTVAYVKQRHQFGVPIGSFQAVKHKAADRDSVRCPGRQRSYGGATKRDQMEPAANPEREGV